MSGSVRRGPSSAYRAVDWRRDRQGWVRLLESKTGRDLQDWIRRVRRQHPPDERSLRLWLGEQGVTGYAQSLLVMEHFGYPDYLRATARELMDGQYRDRARLRPILDAILAIATGLGNVTIQARKGYVSLVTPRRTFARIQATTKTRVDLHLRLEDVLPAGRLLPSRAIEGMPVRMGLSSAADVNPELVRWLTRARQENER